MIAIVRGEPQFGFLCTVAHEPLPGGHGKETRQKEGNQRTFGISPASGDAPCAHMLTESELRSSIGRGDPGR